MRSALVEGWSPGQIRAVIHTACLFDGYPAALEGFRLLGELAEIPKTRHSNFRYSPDNVKYWRRRGQSLCRRVYGEKYPNLMKRVRMFAPELADSMLVNGYGAVLSAPDLDVVTRELCVVAMLVVKSRPRQLLSHSLGALRLGAIPERLGSVPAALARIVPRRTLEEAKRVIQQAIREYYMP